jgi:hypothetical protein
VRITDAALKRGYTVDQIEHAVLHHTDEFHERGNHALAILVGPTQSGELLEVGVLFAADGVTIEVVAHVMPVRSKFLRNKKRR